MRRMMDAFGLPVAIAVMPVLAGVSAAGIVLEPHPGWIAVLLLAARYGTGGFFTGLLAAAGAIGIGSAIAGTGPAWGQLDSGPNLTAFGVCLAVSWITSWHLRRHADLRERLAEASDRVAEARVMVEALRGVATSLRVRVDRTSTSLSFLRDVASRLEGMDPVAAAEGAADLLLARTGASAAAVKVGMGPFLAVRDARGPKELAPLALHDADLTVPIRNGSERVGALALWGIPRSKVDDATAHDLAVIAAWCAPTLAIAAWRPTETADRARRVG